MAWIEAHQKLARHPKTLKLAELMGWSVDETIGKLFRFWFWTLDFAPNGDLRRFNDAVIGGCVDLSGEASKQFVESMVASCWIDRDNDAGVFRVHDWLEYAGRYLKDSLYKRDPARWLEALAVYHPSADSPQTVGGLSPLPDRTGPDRTEPEKERAREAVPERPKPKPAPESLSPPSEKTVAELHAAYVRLTGLTVSLNAFGRERAWYEFAKSGFTVEDLTLVVGHLRRGIEKGERNIGALKFKNLVEGLDKFEDDLAQARAVKRNRFVSTDRSETLAASGRPHERKSNGQPVGKVLEKIVSDPVKAAKALAEFSGLKGKI